MVLPQQSMKKSGHGGLSGELWEELVISGAGSTMASMDKDAEEVVEGGDSIEQCVCITGARSSGGGHDTRGWLRKQQ